MTSRKLLLLGLLTVLVFAGLAGYGDLSQVGSLLGGFPISLLMMALGLAVINYTLRFLRWAYYLRVLKIRVSLGASGLVFLSGLAMTITPGKVGEVLKSYLLRQRTSVPVSSSIPIVFMERLSDVVAIVLLALTGLVFLPLPAVVALVAALLLCGGVLLLGASKYGGRMLHMPVLRRWESAIQSTREGLKLLSSPKVLVIAVLLGTTAWLSEGLAMWVILKGLNTEISLSKAVPIYAAATMVGAVTTLPGGLVGTESSMVALLQQAGLTRAAASTGTLLIRLVTLWLAVMIGLLALLYLNKSLTSRSIDPRLSYGEPKEPLHSEPVGDRTSNTGLGIPMRRSTTDVVPKG